MVYRLPPYIVAAKIDDPKLTFRWDDWKASGDFTYDPKKVVARAQTLTNRAQVALGIGMYEWTLGRFASLSEDPTPYQIAEAAWCAEIDRRYMKRIEFDRRKWLGPVRGPLWCAMTWLIPLVLSGDNDPEELESGLAYLPRLAMHVLPKPEIFEQWLITTLERLASWYTATPEGPLDDLFSVREEERRGPLVAPEALDPAFDYDPAQAPTLLAKRLAAIQPSLNPYLQTPEEMRRDGFPGTPYQF